jgi:hypothetical protein
MLSSGTGKRFIKSFHFSIKFRPHLYCKLTPKSRYPACILIFIQNTVFHYCIIPIAPIDLNSPIMFSKNKIIKQLRNVQALKQLKRKFAHG